MKWQDNCVVLLEVFSFLVQEAAWEKTVLGLKQKRWCLTYMSEHSSFFSDQKLVDRKRHRLLRTFIVNAGDILDEAELVRQVG